LVDPEHVHQTCNHERPKAPKYDTNQLSSLVENENGQSKMVKIRNFQALFENFQQPPEFILNKEMIIPASDNYSNEVIFAQKKVPI